MTKNIIIVVLAVVIVGIGGWLIYDNTRQTATPRPADVSQAKPNASDSKVLDYSDKTLTSVSSSIYDQTDATQLILSYNSLTSLPSQLGGMNKLQVLKVDHNQLRGSLIAEIRKMPLVTLDASYNTMTGVPAEIGQLSHLQTLNYSYNKITALPNEISYLQQLKILDLTGNPLSADQISQLRSKLPNTEIIF